MSYTYRTDKLLDAIGNDQGFVNQRNCPKQWVGFAIELETELQEAKFEIERLRKSNLQLREGAEEAKQRIKRLEEALGLVLKMRNDWLENQEDGYEGAYYAFVKGNDSEWEEIIKAKEAKL